jgi:hypothetical protein
MREYVAWIEGEFDLLEPGKVRTPIRVLPVGQVKVAVIHVGGAGYVGAHGHVERLHVAEALWRVAGVRPRTAVLDAIERAAVRERSRVGGDAGRRSVSCDSPDD